MQTWVVVMTCSMTCDTHLKKIVPIKMIYFIVVVDKTSAEHVILFYYLLFYVLKLFIIIIHAVVWPHNCKKGDSKWLK